MRRAAVLLSALAIAAAALTTSAATPASGTLTADGPPVTWDGTFGGGEHLLTPVPDLRCLEGACDTFTLEVALGDLWQSTEGAVEVAIRWTYDFITDLDLVVSRDGTEVARSEAVDSNAESVFIEDAADGTYVVTVIPTNTFDPDSEPRPIPYEGLAEVVRFPTGGTGDDLLPNLISLAPHNFHIASAANLLPFPENPVLSCYPEETIESPAHPTRCLRFDQTIANTGAGPLELRFLMDGALSPGTDDDRMIQRIYDDAGGRRDVVADTYELHLVHGHVHYRGFGQSFLWPYDPTIGERTGDGTPAKIGNKVGFCVIDVLLLDGYWGGTPGALQNGPRSRTFPTCNLPTETNDEGTWMVQGIDVGWADVYGWNLADQYIDITGLPDGVYELEQVANPNGSIAEATHDDNCASTIIRIEGDVVTPMGSSPAGPCTSH